jgi:phenylalanyl-tRNA synthetase alpha chain
MNSPQLPSAMEDELIRLKDHALADLAGVSGVAELEPFRIKYLGRKGAFTQLMRQLGTVSVEERPRIGKLANEIKLDLENAFVEAEARLAAVQHDAASQGAFLDLTLPGRVLPFGNLNTVTQIMEEVCAIYVATLLMLFLERGQGKTPVTAGYVDGQV